MPRGRPASPTTALALPQPELNQQALAEANGALSALSAATLALQQQLGLDTADPLRLEAEIVSWIDATSRAMFEIGRRLLLLRSYTPQGDWLALLARLNMPERTARRFMQATMKFVVKLGKGQIPERIGALPRSSVFELVVLDDEQLDELAESGRIAQAKLTLDAIACMSPSELRKALRDSRQQAAAKDKLLKKRGENLDRLNERIERGYQPRPDTAARNAQEQELIDALHKCTLVLQGEALRLTALLRDIDSAGGSDALRAEAHDSVANLAMRLADMVREHGIPVDFEQIVLPGWLQKAKAAKA